MFTEIFVCRMQRFFPARRTDLQLFSLGNISYWLDNVLMNNEVAVVSAVNCLMGRNWTRIHKTINIPEIFSGVRHGFTGKTFTRNSRLPVRLHLVAEANERRLYSQARKACKTCISKTHNILQFKQENSAVSHPQPAIKRTNPNPKFNSQVEHLFWILTLKFRFF